MEKYVRLLRRVEITRECRYAAEKRLNRRNQKAYYVISLLSLFVIVVSVLPNVHSFDDNGLQWLLLITILNSVFIIVTTLVDVAGNYALNEYHMRCSARNLDIVLNKLILATDEQKCDLDWLSIVHREYQDVLHDCPTDHIPVDYLAVKVRQPHLFEANWENQGPKRRLTGALFLSMSLHFHRAKWMIPHGVAVLFSLGLIAEIWYPDKDILGIDLLGDHSLLLEDNKLTTAGADAQSAAD